MKTRIPVKPQLLDWALKRSGMSEGSARYDKFSRWAAGEGLPPTFRQLEEFASATHAPLGYLFLQEPPEETVPIPDPRLPNAPEQRSVEPQRCLLDTIYEAQQRQDWYTSYAIEQGHDPLPFVGSVDLQTDPVVVADEIRRALDFGMDRRSRFRTWEEALRELIDSIEQLGVLVMVFGHRREQHSPDS